MTVAADLIQALREARTELSVALVLDNVIPYLWNRGIITHEMAKDARTVLSAGSYAALAAAILLIPPDSGCAWDMHDYSAARSTLFRFAVSLKPFASGVLIPHIHLGLGHTASAAFASAILKMVIHNDEQKTPRTEKEPQTN